MIFVWSLSGRWEPERESWRAFCERAAGYTIAVLQAERAGGGSLPAIEAEVRQERPDLWPHVWYNLTFAGRARYEATQSES
jgi:hypothetical protein